MHKNEKIALALVVVALLNVAVWPLLFEGRSDGLTASIQGILFSLPALIVDAIPQLSGRAARVPHLAPGQRDQVTDERVAIWACAAYGILSLVAGIIGVTDVDHFEAAYESCTAQVGANCEWLIQYRVGIEATEQRLDELVTLVTFPIAALMMGCMLAYWIANRSPRPLYHVVIAAGVLATFRALDATLVRAFEGADSGLLRFIVVWLLAFTVWAATGLGTVLLAGRQRMRLARELADARLNRVPTLPEKVAAAISAKAPGHEVRIRERRSPLHPLAHDLSRALLRDWVLCILSLAIALALGMALVYAVYGAGKIEGPNFSAALVLLGLCTSAPIFAGLRKSLESAQRRFLRTWLRDSNTAEALLLFVLVNCIAAGISTSVYPMLVEYKNEYVANGILGLAGVFADYEMSAVDTMEGGLMFILLFAVGVRIGSHARWAVSLGILLLPLIVLSITNVYDRPEPPESLLNVIWLALLCRAAPLLLGILASKVGRSLALARDRVVAGELLKGDLSNRKLGEAIVSALGLDTNKYELVARAREPNNR